MKKSLFKKRIKIACEEVIGRDVCCCELLFFVVLGAPKPVPFAGYVMRPFKNTQLYKDFYTVCCPSQIKRDHGMVGSDGHYWFGHLGDTSNRQKRAKVLNRFMKEVIEKKLYLKYQGHIGS